MTIRAGASRRFAPENRGTVFAAVLHELLNGEQFGSLADAAEALKCRCAGLRLRYAGPAIAAALESVARSRPICRPFAARRGELTPHALSGSPRPTGVEVGSRGPQFSQRDALEALERVRRGPSC